MFLLSSLFYLFSLHMQRFWTNSPQEIVFLVLSKTVFLPLQALQQYWKECYFSFGCDLVTSLLIPPSFSSQTWHLPDHFFFNFLCLLHTSPSSHTHFLPCHTYNNTHLCLVCPLPHCSSQVKQKSPTFAEDCSSNLSPTTREAIHLPANWCYSVENITHTISNKSIQHQISVGFPPLITRHYTETEFYFTQEAKWASSVRQLLECSSVSEPFPTVGQAFGSQSSSSLLPVVSKATRALVPGSFYTAQLFHHQGPFALLGLLEQQSVSRGLCSKTKSSSWLQTVKQTTMAPLLFQQPLCSFLCILHAQAKLCRPLLLMGILA